jgi:hypothetical protein
MSVVPPELGLGLRRAVTVTFLEVAVTVLEVAKPKRVLDLAEKLLPGCYCCQPSAVSVP